MAAAVGTPGDHVPTRVEGPRVVSCTGVCQIQRPSDEGLIEEPCPAAENACWLPAHPTLEHRRLHLAEGCNQDTKIESLVAECETQMGDDCVFRGVPRRIQLDDPLSIHLRAPGARNDVALDGRPRNRQFELAKQPRLADGAAGVTRHGSCGGKAVTEVAIRLQ